MTADTVRVEYVGNKPTKKDTVTHSDVIWMGPGDVQPVPVKIAEKLLRFPSVWREAGKKSAPKIDNKPAIQEQGSVYDEVEEGDTTPAERLNKSEPVNVDAIPAVKEDPAKSEPEAIQAEKLSVKDALLKMDRANPEHFGGKGKPIIAKVREISGNPAITVAEVAEAWNTLNG